MQRIWIVSSCAFALIGCGGGDESRTRLTRAELRAVGSCEDLEGVIRQSLIEEMTQRVMANFRSVVERSNCWEDDGGADGGVGWAGADADADADADASPDEDYAGDGDDGADQYSTTNLQEADVDEADFVKNDGNHIYIVAANQFLIIDAWPADASSVIATVDIEGTPRRLFVEADRAIIYSEVPLAAPEGVQIGGCRVGPWGEWICEDNPGGTRITVLDIEDRAAPRLVRTIEVAGRYEGSRRIDDAIHTVMTYPGIHSVALSDWPEGVDACDDRDELVLWALFRRLLAENEAIIEGLDIDVLVPSMVDTRYAADGSASVDEDLLRDCSNVFQASLSTGRSFLSVLSFDLTVEEEVKVSAIVGESGVVYSSREALYVATQQARGDGAWYWEEGGADEATTIHRFAYDVEDGQPVAIYDASGVVAGRVLNQFAMSENGGDLRIATTTGFLPDPECHNDVFVLRPIGDRLEVIGSVTGFAQGEDIRSARFIGTRGYVVTFKKTDPLFVIDLSDPFAPTIEGELHIPGFSTYLHPMDRNHLLTIGFDAQDEGDFAWFQGIELQIFDVTRMDDPLLEHVHYIGTRGTSSEATSNHLAFNYFAPLDLLAIPMAICEGGDGGMYGDEMTFNGLMVFDVTTDDGFAEHGRIAHAIAGDDEYYGGACSNWWTSSNSRVKRSIIMDDFVFSIATEEIQVANLADLATPVAAIPLPFVAPAEDEYEDY